MLNYLSLKKYQKPFTLLGILFGAFCWGVIWYPYRLMEEGGISGVASCFYSYFIIVSLVALVKHQQWRAALNQPKSFIVLALFAGWTNLSYVLAIIDGEVMRVMLLFYLSPLWTLVMAHFWLKERTNKRGLAVIVLSLIGAFTMFWQDGALPLPKNTAEWLALSSGFCFSMTNVITRQASYLSVTAKSMAVWVGVLLMSLIFIAFQEAPFPNPANLHLSQVLLLITIAGLILTATLLVQYGITHVPVTKASVLFMFELVVAAVAAYFLTDEALSAREWLGGALIVAAALFAATNE
jgi:drug/metabolite transporter (DMT)-like permease